MTVVSRKPVIGVVGGIGAGKSTVAAALARRGGAVVDADALGHRALELPAVKGRLVDRWGVRVLRPDGTADRRAIAGVVFADPAERRALEGLVFPHIRRLAEERIAAANADPAARFVVLDAAVLLEAGWDGVCDKLVYVDAPRAVRLARLAARSGWAEPEVAAREAAQLAEAEKRGRADAVLVNDGPPDRLDAQIDQMLAGWGLPPTAH
ncbi:MAG: dephospho-CoA kinase [Gemmataceae bacterium]